MTDSLACRLCAAAALPTLRGRPDHEYGVPVQLDYWRCTGCGLVFVEPIPSALVPSFYAAYSTHERADVAGRSSLWRLIDAVTPAIDHAGSFTSLNITKAMRILDFGCGGGAFLAELRDAGFTELAGCDFDPNVAATALPGLRFFTGIDQLADEKFDVITMNHVLEHVEDVPATLARLRLHLKSGGFIYIRTPNPRSALAKLFGTSWRGWETPRHLNLLTPKAMRRAVEEAGGTLAMLVTSNDMRAGMLIASVGIALGGRLPAKIGTFAGVALYVPALGCSRACTPPHLCQARSWSRSSVSCARSCLPVNASTNRRSGSRI